MKQFPIITMFAAILACSVSTQAQTFNESTLGDFSNVSTAPTSLGQLPLGINTISGNTGSGDRDIVTFSIGANETLSAFTITEFTQAGGHFFGFAGGNTAPGAGSGFFISDLVSSAETPFTVLGAAGGQFGGTGVPASLGAGDYTVFFNETGGVSPDYSAQLEVTSVPEPSSVAILLVLSSLMLMRFRKS